MALPLAAWVSQSLASKLGIGLGIEFASQLYDVLTDREEKSLIEHDKMVRSQSVDAVMKARMELKNATFMDDDPGRKRDVFMFSRRLDGLKNKIEYSEAPLDDQNEKNRDTISYLNILIMGKSLSLLDKTRSLSDETDAEIKITIISEAIQEIRTTEKYNDLRNMLIKTNEPNILKNLSNIEPELFINLRNLAGISFKINTSKKSILNKSQYYDDLRGSILMMLDDLVIRRGPVIGLAEMYTEYKKEYPIAEVTEGDFEKTVTNLSENGYLEDVTQNDKGYKIVKIKPIKMTGLYQEIINYVGSTPRFQQNGVIIEEMVLELQLNPSLAESAFEEMEKNDIAWKHDNRYYFPGLSLKATEIRLETVR